MKNLNSDHLIQHAFGELSPEVAAELEAFLNEDQESMKEYQMLISVREDLRSLPVPEHQLSTERLRHAILSQGLEPKKSVSHWWKFIVTPVAAATLFLGLSTLFRTFMMSSETSSSTTNVVAMNPISTSLDPRLSGVSDPSGQPGSAMAQRDPIGSGPDSSRSEFSPQMGGRPNMPVPTLSYGGSEAQPEESKAPIHGLVAMKGSPSQGTEVPEAALAAIKSAARSEPSGDFDRGLESQMPVVIVIGSKRDAQTGAMQATEVSSGSDIVIGG